MEIFNTADLVMSACAVLYMMFDVISGVIKGAKLKNLSSTKMREGLAHKAMYILFIAMSYTLQWGASYLELPFDAPAVIVVCFAIICIESLSIVENAGEINPELKGSKLLQMFELTNKEGK